MFGKGLWPECADKDYDAVPHSSSPSHSHSQKPERKDNQTGHAAEKGLCVTVEVVGVACTVGSLASYLCCTATGLLSTSSSSVSDSYRGGAPRPLVRRTRQLCGCGVFENGSTHAPLDMRPGQVIGRDSDWASLRQRFSGPSFCHDQCTSEWPKGVTVQASPGNDHCGLLVVLCHPMGIHGYMCSLTLCLCRSRCVG